MVRMRLNFQTSVIKQCTSKNKKEISMLHQNFYFSGVNSLNKSYFTSFNMLNNLLSPDQLHNKKCHSVNLIEHYSKEESCKLDLGDF